MKQQKNNSKMSRLMGRMVVFMLLLCASLLVASVGVTYARYREEHHGKIDFQVKEPEQIYLGIMDDEEFTPVDRLEWSEGEDGVSLYFAVANGSSETDYFNADQKVQLSLIGSLGLMKDGELPVVSVVYGNDQETKVVQATATAIEKGTTLYHSYGDGWLYRFYESTIEGQKELNWDLPGGKFSYIRLFVSVKGETSENMNLLQPLITAETITKD